MLQFTSLASGQAKAETFQHSALKFSLTLTMQNCLVIGALLSTCTRARAQEVMVVDLLSSPPPPATIAAVQVCAGLFNRNKSSAQSAYTIMHPEDLQWLSFVVPGVPVPPKYTSIAAFIAACFASPAVATGRIRYNFSSQQAIVPNLLTVAAVLDAVPLEDDSPFLPPALPVVFDALSVWAEFSPLNATQYVYEHFVNSTTTLAKMNPGYDLQSHPLNPNPPLTGQPDLSLTDYIVSARLFNFYLVCGCIPGTAEHALVTRIAATNPWPQPMAVWGYDDTFPVAGDLFEAETTCFPRHNAGQVATTGVNNLAFFSRSPPVTAPLRQNPTPPIAFNVSKTYITFIVGDGDNVAYIKGSRMQWVLQRAAQCAGVGGCGFPLAWSISPHLFTAAPAILRWYFDAAAKTGEDYFTLPPSGHLYAYPGIMEPPDQARFVAATEADAELLNASSTVEWEFAGTWPVAIANYMPRYATRGIVRALFAVNVPYMFPITEFSEGEYFKILNNSVVLFRPNEWRGTTGGLIPPFMLNASAFAARINSYPLGTVSHIYMTSDGGAQLSDFTALASHLAEHVQIVPPAALAHLAVQSRSV